MGNKHTGYLVCVFETTELVLKDRACVYLRVLNVPYEESLSQRMCVCVCERNAGVCLVLRDVSVITKWFIVFFYDKAQTVTGISHLTSLAGLRCVCVSHAVCVCVCERCVLIILMTALCMERSAITLGHVLSLLHDINELITWLCCTFLSLRVGRLFAAVYEDV